MSLPPLFGKECQKMRTASKHSSRLKGRLLFSLVVGLIGASGFAYAADRAVVGELLSADN